MTAAPDVSGRYHRRTDITDEQMIAGKSIAHWVEAYPVLNPVIRQKEVFWSNPAYREFQTAGRKIPLTPDDIREAEARLQRFAPCIRRLFPDTEETAGIIESPLKRIDAAKDALAESMGTLLPGTLLLKCDSHLAVAGSIKARGGIYEVLKHAEDLALSNGLLGVTDDYAVLDSDRFRRFFGRFSIAVGSTGNLGLSIGIMSAALGFKVFVHMSADAKSWKKELLRQKGAVVIEYEDDYSRAVKEGRCQADADPNMHFIDDEHSTDLFLGYATAALRLKNQLDDLAIRVDAHHPLFVYLPCGVGGSPGGITFGLKQIFGDDVHCFFAEPTASPCMLLGLVTGLHDRVSVRDFGLDNITDADGLACPSPSGFVGNALSETISGLYTVRDQRLYDMLRMIADHEGIFLEPSALAGVPGGFFLNGSEEGRAYIRQQGLNAVMADAVHIAWATGGSMVPEAVMDTYYAKGS